ncbi:Glycosyl transferase, group 1 [Sulfurimonas denitrificans DSM 1251]|uniref:Glycosyl transferase, group 1 n=1 Tax=Sulfurimonas denitrificans (strain ATCC 33889 / DSM 1251) TaxID=326298 RepID=Q30U59_SULDN|nr:glycosyltransferase [Sulfurimonas denitrificans]ABB43472.1 Glycosyl transferase, group 1 [Sulfurimonas denitrificans DSM 1251]
MKKIAFFTQNLSTGGVQKSVSSLANYLASYYDVSIILAEDNKALNYFIDKKIKIHKIKTKKVDIKKDGVGRELFDYRASELDKILHDLDADLTISYEDYNNFILLQTKNGCKKVLSCRVSLSESYKKDSFIHLLESSFYFEMIKESYQKADLIIAVAKHIENELLQLNSAINSRTIYNGIKEMISVEDETEHNNFILNVGRLHPQKGQKDLIYAFNDIKDEINEKLIILGDGGLRQELESLILELNLQNRVLLKGFANPYPYIKKCSLFVFPSYYEGFSNSILELMSVKKAIVSYNYKGADEILPKGSLVELSDTENLSKKILHYLKNKSNKQNLGNKLYEICKKFTLQKSFDSFHSEFEQLLS